MGMAWHRWLSPAWGVCLLAGVALIRGTAAAESDEGGVPHPDARSVDAPRGGAAVAVNPPALLWPSEEEGGKVRYAVRLSQDASFPEGATIESQGFRWALFNPHRKLKEGTWFWQHGVVGKDGATKWSPTNEFRVDASARVFETPPAETMLARAAAERPRMLLDEAEAPALRERMKGTKTLGELIAKCEGMLGQPLPDESGGKTDKKGANEQQARDFAKWASKEFAGDMTRDVSNLVPTWLMTGDERFGREAVRLTLCVAGWDPEGVTSPNVSDFADGDCMRVLAMTYDSCYGLMSEKERTTVREALAYRLRRFYEGRVGRLETRAWNAHIWQHIFLDFADASLALLDEQPEAREWATYFYETWIARFPLMGGDDGGWAEGSNYFAVSYSTLLGAPSLFGRLTGVDFFDHPWYPNDIYFHLYTHPPKSASDGFGDGGEKEERPDASGEGIFVDILARHFNDPYGLWYARQVRGNRDDLEDVSTIRLLASDVWKMAPPSIEPKAPSDLPMARVFPDVGIVSMHTDLCNAATDLMVGFRSSPFGGGGHMHASQNSFNLLIGGERLFANSGDYTAAKDEHCNQWYRATRGCNSVLIDGKGQMNDREGYGRVTRFVDGERISYCQGDASTAYGDAGLTRFRRSLVMLRPSILVVYDDLEADHPAEWDWLLHSKGEIDATKAGDDQRFTAAVSKGRGQADVWGSGHAVGTVDTKFDPPALNWRGRDLSKIGGDYPDQWHVKVQPEAPAPGARFLAVIQARLTDDSASMAEPARGDDGTVKVGGWSIRAELDPTRKATLTIVSADGKAGLTEGGGEIAVAGGEPKAPLSPDSTLLIEEADGKRIVKEAKDEGE